MTQWYEASFGEDYLALYPHRNSEEARADVSAIIRLLEPPRQEPLLDLCCGAGRHLFALLEAGFSDLTGIDLSQTLLDIAQKQLDSQRTTHVRLVRSDMRDIPFREEFCTILSLFTSFGYFGDTAEDQRVLTAAYSALRPGGTFLMDTLNRAWTIAHLAPRTKDVIDGNVVSMTRTISPDGLRVEKDTRIEPIHGQPRTYRESVRMYETDDLRAMLGHAGFTDLRFYGALDGRPHDAMSPRTIAIAHRPSAQGPR